MFGFTSDGVQTVKSGVSQSSTFILKKDWLLINFANPSGAQGDDFTSLKLKFEFFHE